jgi:hypothetical protein
MSTTLTIPRFDGEQMTTVFLPNPRIGDDHQLMKTPDWSRLDTYYRLREKFLGEPMPEDFETAAERTLPEIG